MALEGNFRRALGVAVALALAIPAARGQLVAVEDDALNQEARKALADAGVPQAETARVLRIYAAFEEGSEDPVVATIFNLELIGCAGNTTFYQDPHGGTTPPDPTQIEQHPALAFDSFATINLLEAMDPPVFEPLPNAVFDEFVIDGKWFNPDPSSDLGEPRFDLGDGLVGVLIAQWTVLGNEAFMPYALAQGEIPAVTGTVGVFVDSKPNPDSFLFHPGGVGEGPCPPDLTGDFVINGADLGMLLGEWGQAGQPIAADLNCDGVVDGADVGLMLGEWGPCS